MKQIKIITGLERMQSSVSGNPRFRVQFDDGTSAPTKPDTMWAYGAQNREEQNVPTEVTFDGRGHVVYANPVEL